MNTLGVGVDVGGTTIKAVLAGDDGVVRERVDPAPTPHTGAEDVARVVASMAKPLLALAGPGPPWECACRGSSTRNEAWASSPPTSAGVARPCAT